MIVPRFDGQMLAPAVVKDAFVRPHAATRANVRALPVQDLDAVPATSRLQAFEVGRWRAVRVSRIRHDSPGAFVGCQA